jgi:hypothetical protein
MSVLRRLLRSGKARFLIGVLAAWLAFEGYLSWAAPRKVAEGFPEDRRSVDARVVLRFPPERFHIQVFQAYGRVSGARGESVELRGIERARLPELARYYWVRRVEPLAPRTGQPIADRPQGG